MFRIFNLKNNINNIKIDSQYFLNELSTEIIIYWDNMCLGILLEDKYRKDFIENLKKIINELGG